MLPILVYVKTLCFVFIKQRTWRWMVTEEGIVRGKKGVENWAWVLCAWELCKSLSKGKNRDEGGLVYLRYIDFVVEMKKWIVRCFIHKVEYIVKEMAVIPLCSYAMLPYRNKHILTPFSAHNRKHRQARRHVNAPSYAEKKI